MSDITFVLVLVNLMVVVFVYFNLSRIIKAQTTSAFQQLSQDLSQQLTTNYNLNKDELLDKITSTINNNSQQQITHLSDTKSRIDLKFQDIQSNLQLHNSKHSQDSKSEFQDLKSLNQQSLIELQRQIQESISKAIGDLSLLTSQNFENLRVANQEKLDQINQQVQNRLELSFDQHKKSFEDVTKNIGQVQTLAQRMIDSTTSIDKLNNVFGRTSSKSFGDFGERYLESLLRENLNSSSWSSQVQVPNSADKIDFVVNTQGKRIGIDSKFPLTKYQDYLDCEGINSQQAHKNFLDSVKKMADDIAKKYSKVGFVDYLFLYLPSDSMYTLVADNEATVAYLQKNGITPISPITIFPMILGIKTYQYHDDINQNAEIIIKGLKVIDKNIGSFQDEFRKLGDKLRIAQNNYESADRSLYLISKEIKSLDGKQDITATDSLL